VKVRFEHGPGHSPCVRDDLGYSRRAYAEGFENERIGSLLAAHEHAFAHFGGRCAELLYDRIRTVGSARQVVTALGIRPLRPSPSTGI